MTYNGLQVFDLNIDDEFGVFEAVSLVDFPAIQRDFIHFAEDKGYMRFSRDDEKHIVSGPVLIPDQLIYRTRGNQEFYVRFGKEAIEEMELKFFKDHRNTEGDVMHEIKVNGVTYFESYIIDKERNIAPVEFSDLPDGTWMMSAKIENEELWNLIKEGQIRGFSIDAQCSITPAKDEIDNLDDLIEYLNKQ